MNFADPKYLEHLRDLPSSYLLDLLADFEDIDAEAIYRILQDRGMQYEVITEKAQRRRNSNWPRPYMVWTSARWLTLFNAVIVSYFNINGLYELVQGDHAFKGPILFLSVGCIIFGFVVGFKLTTYIYHGSKSLLYCGFPIPVGRVELKTGKELPVDKLHMYLNMIINALVGVSLTLFPLIFIYITMN